MGYISQIKLPNNSIYDIIDEKVSQIASTSADSFPVLLGGSTAPNGGALSSLYSEYLSVVPSTGQLNSTGGFVGNLSGRATNAGLADVATVANSFADDTTIKLTGAITGEKISKRGWTIPTTLSNNSVSSSHIVDSSITLGKLASEIGVVVVQSEEPAANSAAKVWIKI